MPSPLTHTTLIELIKLLLRRVDSYNANDLTLSKTGTTENTSGEIARISLNFALQKMYSLIKDSRYLESYPTTKLKTTIGQDFIDLDEEASLDEIEAVTDASINQIKYVRRSWNWYRRNFPAPSNSTGEPKFYIRRNNRMYLAPRPNVERTLTIDFRKFAGDLKLNNDLPLLPTPFNYWIVAEAAYLWFQTEDPESVPQTVIADRDDARVTAIGAINSDYDSSLQTRSALNRRSETRGAFDRLHFDR